MMPMSDDLIDAEYYKPPRFSRPKAVAPILSEADGVVNGSRAQDYGENSLPRIAEYWSTYLGVTVTGRDVANLMMLLKLAREGHGAKRDNHVDIAGYVALADQLPV